MKKDEAFRPICGHTWGRSDNIGKLSEIKLEIDNSLNDWIAKQLKNPNARLYQNDFCKIGYFQERLIFDCLPQSTQAMIREIVLSNLDKLNRIS